jgi:hypothetical protein
MSIEDLLFGPEAEAAPAIPSIPEVEQKSKKKPAFEIPEAPTKSTEDILSNLLKPINETLASIEKRLSQPVQFKTSEPQTGSSSAAKQGQERQPGPAGQ